MRSRASDFERSTTMIGSEDRDQGKKEAPFGICDYDQSEEARTVRLKVKSTAGIRSLEG